MTKEQFRQVLILFASLWAVALLISVFHILEYYPLGRHRHGVFATVIGLPAFVGYIYFHYVGSEDDNPDKNNEDK